MEEFEQTLNDNQRRWSTLNRVIGDEGKKEGEEHEKIIKTSDDNSKVTFWNRMNLINVSTDNKFFMFEDRKKDILRIYKLVDKDFN